MDYQGNSNKAKGEGKKDDLPEKNLEPVVASGVVVKKRSIGRKAKDLFIVGDFRSVVAHVITNTIIPEARNLFFDIVVEGAARTFFPDGNYRSRMSNPGRQSRVSYNNYHSNPIRPDVREASYRERTAPPVPNHPRGGPMHPTTLTTEFIFSSKDEAELVIERLNDILDVGYQTVSVADLKELLGLPGDHIDQKWGWISLADVRITQIREGYLVVFPPPEAILYT